MSTDRFESQETQDDIDVLNSGLGAVKKWLTNKRTGSGTTFSFTFPSADIGSYALVFGRYGYASQTLSMSLISHPASDMAYVKNYGEQDLTVSCTGNTITVTLPQTYASVWILSPTGII